MNAKNTVLVDATNDEIVADACPNCGKFRTEAFAAGNRFAMCFCGRLGKVRFARVFRESWRPGRPS